MVKKIMRDPLFLAQKSVDATEDDKQVVTDLLDTLRANLDHCVGMAANMIGFHKRIITFQDEGKIVVMLNPEIIKKSQIYSAKEGCLSLSGQRETKRYRSIKVRYLDMQMKIKIKTFKDFTAQVIQHEIDHCDGILI